MGEQQIHREIKISTFESAYRARPVYLPETARKTWDGREIEDVEFVEMYSSNDIRRNENTQEI